jgi:hypothetical protein
MIRIGLLRFKTGQDEKRVNFIRLVCYFCLE